MHNETEELNNLLRQWDIPDNINNNFIGKYTPNLFIRLPA